MKIALLIAGEYREFDIAHNFWPFLDWPDVDVYVSTWSESIFALKQPNVGISESISLENFKKNNIIVKDYNISDVNKDWFGEATGRRQINRWQAGLELIKKSESKYDIIILIRPDLALSLDTDLYEYVKQIHNENNDEHIYGITGGMLNVPFPFRDAGQVSDLMFIGTYNSVIKLLKLPLDVAVTDIHKFLCIEFDKMYKDLFNLPITEQCVVRPNCRGNYPCDFKQIKKLAKIYWETIHKKFFLTDINSWNSTLIQKDAIVRDYQPPVDRINLWDEYDIDKPDLDSKRHMWHSPDTLDRYNTYKNKPRFLNCKTYGEHDIEYLFNYYGFRRGRLDPIDFRDGSPAGTKRDNDFNYASILYGGCSVTEGIGLPEEHIWHSFLHNQISADANQPILKFNIGRGGASIDTVVRFTYISIEHKGCNPDLVYLLLPPVGRRELIVNDEAQEKTFIWHYIPLLGLFDTVPVIKRVNEIQDTNINIRQQYHDAFKNLLFLKAFLKSKNIPWFFSFWTNEFDLGHIKTIAENPTFMDSAFPSELNAHYIELPQVDIIDSSGPMEQHIARDFMHYGPNAHFKLYKSMHNNLLERNEYIQFLDVMKNRKWFK